MRSPAPSGYTGLNALQWEGLPSPSLPPLEAADVVDILSSHPHASDGPWHVREHPRSGRNRIYRLEDAEGRNWLAKQSLTFADVESRFYAGPAAGLDFVLTPRLADPASGLIVIPELRDVRPADDPARDAAAVAEALARLHGIAGDTRESWSAPAKKPFPDMDPVDVLLWEDSSPAARALINRVQASEVLSQALRALREPGGTLALIHGDLKVDNVLLSDGDLWIVDWECAGMGPAEWDVAGVAASWLIEACDRVARILGGEPLADSTTRDVPSPSGADPGAALLAVQTLVQRYRQSGGRALDTQYLANCLAAWMVGRSWVQASFLPGQLPAAVEFRLLLAEDIMAHPDRLADAV